MLARELPQFSRPDTLPYFQRVRLATLSLRFNFPDRSWLIQRRNTLPRVDVDSNGRICGALSVNMRGRRSERAMKRYSSVLSTKLLRPYRAIKLQGVGERSGEHRSCLGAGSLMSGYLKVRSDHLFCNVLTSLWKQANRKKRKAQQRRRQLLHHQGHACAGFHGRLTSQDLLRVLRLLLRNTCV